MRENISIVGSGVGSIAVLEALNNSKQSNVNITIFSKNHSAAGFAYKECPKSFIMNTRLDSLTQFNDVVEIDSWLFNKEYTEYNNDSFIPRSVYGEYLLDVSKKIKANLLADGAEIIHLGEIDSIDQHGDINYQNKKIKTSSTILSMGFGADTFKESLIEDIQNLPKNEKVTVVGSGLTAIDIIVLISDLRPDVIIECISLTGRFPRVRGNFSSGGESIFDRYKNKFSDVNVIYEIFKGSISNEMERRIVFDKNIPLKDEIEYVEENNQVWQELIYNGTNDYVGFYSKLPLKQKKLIFSTRDEFINVRAMFPIINAKKLNELIENGILTIKKGKVDLKLMSSQKNVFFAINKSNHDQFIERSHLPKNIITGIDVDNNCKVLDSRNIYALGPITNGCRYFTEASSLTHRDANLAVSTMLKGSRYRSGNDYINNNEKTGNVDY